MKLVTAAQMRDLEQQAVAGGASLDELMEQAGLAVAQEAWLTLGVVAGRRIVVLVGPGNNGGDGLVAARHLAEWEADVFVYLLGPRAASDPLMERLRELNVPLASAADDGGLAAASAALDSAELVIDALLGTGRSRPIHGAFAEVLRRLARARLRAQPPLLIAVDVPTGVDADCGRADALTVRADITVACGLAKAGLYTLPGAEYAGRIQVVDIGLPPDAQNALPLELLDTRWVRERLPKRPLSGNKGSFGRVLVAGGSKDYVGAPRLAAEACYRAGAGLVTIACPASIQPMLAPALPEATWLPLPEDDGSITPTAAALISDRLRSYDVLLIGPGLGQRDGIRALVAQTLAAAPKTLRGCVIDADALNALSATPGWESSVQTHCVLTPHPGEMARLLGSSVDAVQDDRLHLALQAAADWRQTVVLKGANSVVAAADGRAAISPHANPVLATAGTGDVLAGVIAGLIAHGAEPFDAAACGVFVHGLAAAELSEQFGDRGMLATDLLAAIPRAVRLVLEGRQVPRVMPGLGDLAAAFAGRLDAE